MKQVINNMVLANNLDIVVWIVLTKIYPSMLNYLRFQLTYKIVTQGPHNAMQYSPTDDHHHSPYFNVSYYFLLSIVKLYFLKEGVR